MPSPFPGMNPFLENEDVWLDFHQGFLQFLRELLTPQVRPDYLVKTEQHMFVHETETGEGPRRLLGVADVGLSRGESPLRSAVSAIIEAPATANLPTIADAEPHDFLEIRSRQGGELVTVVELLSPTNKRTGPHREQYLAKRRQILASNVHLVEIDLLRGGPRMPLEDLPDCDYLVVVSRVKNRPRVDIWPMRLRDPLPRIPIPLLEGDREAEIELRRALDRIYDAAGYEDYIYRNRPQPLLHPVDAAWATSILPGAGLAST